MRWQGTHSFQPLVDYDLHFWGYLICISITIILLTIVLGVSGDRGVDTLKKAHVTAS